MVLKLFWYLKKFGLKDGFLNYIININYNKLRESQKVILRRALETRKINIIVPPAAVYAAKYTQSQLTISGYESEIFLHNEIKHFTDDLYIVLCPYIMKKLPKCYVAFHLEQVIFSRKWQRLDKLYYTLNAIEQIDYSTININYFLDNISINESSFHYLPIGYLPDYSKLKNISQPKKYDVLFYGGFNPVDLNHRRTKFINAISNHFNVRVIGGGESNSVFGDAIKEEICKAKIVINIHNWRNSLLETTRIFECLSLNTLVISESSTDLSYHQHLQNIIVFTELGNIEEMIEKIKLYLDDNNREAKIKENIKALEDMYKDNQAIENLMINLSHKLSNNIYSFQADR